ncbi:MAG: hypothetical protein HWQ35_08495, partial [Nostoc sp. NMS1]|uniref:phosphorylase family protein n=1 Tax=Nostoc sp. NMS1 TaxID=2815388 RepID=UPI0025E62824
MGFRAARAEDVYRYALRLDEPNRTLTDRFGFSLIVVNDDSPVCIEFLQRYFVDLCHRTADRIRFIFFSELDARELERNVRYDTPLQVILKMLPRTRRGYPHWQNEYPERGVWDELRPRGFRPVHFPEQTLRKLNLDIQGFSAVPGRREAYRFAQRLGIGRHVPCIVVFNDIGSLSVDVMPIGEMSSNEIYYHVREWVDSFYEQNQSIFNSWSELEKNIEQLQKKANIPLLKIKEWQYSCRYSWDKLRIIAQAIFEFSLLKENDRLGLVNLLEKYNKDYHFPDEVVRKLEKICNYWYNPKIGEILLQIEDNLVHTVGFEQLYNQLINILKELRVNNINCPAIAKNVNKLKALSDELSKKERRRIVEYLDWHKKRANSRLSYDKFRFIRKGWEYLLNQYYQDTHIQDEFKYIFQFIRQFPLSIKPKEGGEKTRDELAKYYTIDPKNEQWLAATYSFLNMICNYINTIQKTCPQWFIAKNPNITIREAIPLDNELGGDAQIERIPKDHPLFTAIFENPESIQEKKIIADECRTQCLKALRESILQYTLIDDNFLKMRSSFLEILQEHRTQLELKVNEIQKEILSVGFLKRKVTPEEIQRIKNELDKYQSVVNQFIYPHKADTKVINVTISQPLLEACDLSNKSVANRRINQKDINTLIQEEIDSIPRKEQNNLEEWNKFTQIAKKMSPQHALSYALEEALSQSTIEEVFNLSEEITPKNSISLKEKLNTSQKKFSNGKEINIEENINTLLKEANIILPLLRLTEDDLNKVVNILSQDTSALPIKFDERTRPVEQILILIGADVIPALNYIKNANMSRNKNIIIMNLEPVIGIITALDKEYVAVQAVFDQGREDKKEGKGAGRRYWLSEVAGTEGTSRTVALTLADMGNNAAAVRAATMLSHYPTIELIIMCGIAGGVPHPQKVEDHVRLGDIVISNKKGIVQYDFDKESQEFTEIRAMPVPASAELVEAARYLRVSEMQGKRSWKEIISRTLQ